MLPKGDFCFAFFKLEKEINHTAERWEADAVAIMAFLKQTENTANKYTTGDGYNHVLMSNLNDFGWDIQQLLDGWNDIGPQRMDS